MCGLQVEQEVGAGWLTFSRFLIPGKLCGYRTVGVPRALKSSVQCTSAVMCVYIYIYICMYLCYTHGSVECSWISKIYLFGQGRWFGGVARLHPLTLLAATPGFNYTSFPRRGGRGMKNKSSVRVAVKIVFVFHSGVLRFDIVRRLSFVLSKEERTGPLKRFRAPAVSRNLV